MLFLRLFLSLSISLGLIFSVGGAPAPPPLVHSLHHTTTGLVHSWHGWEPAANADPSSLVAYVKAAHDEMNQQAESQGILKKDRPNTMASLWVKNKGVYTATDIGRNPRGLTAELQPTTEALYKNCFTNRNRYGGCCSCIQAIDGFHRNFPNDVIPLGSQIVRYGFPNGGWGPNKILQPCNGNGGNHGCSVLLQADGVDFQFDRDFRKTSKPRKRPLSDTGSKMSSPSNRSSRSTVIPDLNLLPIYNNADET